eukprot:scaffold643040_cov34-Prasinocladus_malaysianus.AAC.2
MHSTTTRTSTCHPHTLRGLQQPAALRYKMRPADGFNEFKIMPIFISRMSSVAVEIQILQNADSVDSNSRQATGRQRNMGRQPLRVGPLVDVVTPSSSTNTYKLLLCRHPRMAASVRELTAMQLSSVDCRSHAVYGSHYSYWYGTVLVKDACASALPAIRLGLSRCTDTNRGSRYYEYEYGDLWTKQQSVSGAKSMARSAWHESMRYFIGSTESLRKVHTYL